jgi:hypothetical protein
MERVAKQKGSFKNGTSTMDSTGELTLLPPLLLGLCYSCPLSKVRTLQEWVAAQIEWLGDQMAGGAQVHNEYLWRTIIDRFKEAFTDTMSVEKAKQAIKEIRMKDGDLDGYIAKFEQLARISGHNLNAKGTWTMFAEGLPKMLHYNMISQGGRCPNSWQEWTEEAVKQQQKWLYLQTFFNGKVP